MASTRSRNTPGNYCLEQWSYGKQNSYLTDRDYAFAPRTLLPGDGLLGAQIPNTELANNPNDIESYLFGIGSTNLVNPSTPVQPEIKSLSSLSIMQKIPLIMPQDLVVQNNQRPFPIPK